MESILNPLRESWGIDTAEERAGVLCGERWASHVAAAEQLQRVSKLATCPGSTWWFETIHAGAVITPERLVSVICGATQTAAECVEFWNVQFGDSDAHAQIWRNPAFVRGFVMGAAAVSENSTTACENSATASAPVVHPAEIDHVAGN